MGKFSVDDDLEEEFEVDGEQADTPVAIGRSTAEVVV